MFRVDEHDPRSLAGGGTPLGVRYDRQNRRPAPAEDMQKGVRGPE